ncbi:MAG: O-antigen ligase family protein [Chitinophagales bacterium]
MSAAFSPVRGVAAALSTGYALLMGGYVFAAQGSDPVWIRRRFVPTLMVASSISYAFAIGRALITDSRRAGTLGSGANGYGTLIILCSGVALGYLLSRDERRRWPALVAYVAVASVALAFTLSRGAWLGFFTMLVVLALWNPQFRRWLWLGLLPLAVAFTAIPRLAPRLLSIFTAEAYLSRVYIWRSAWRMIQDHPLTGVGAGVFMHVYGAYVQPGASEQSVAYAHNLFLQVWAEFGLIGFVIFLAILGRVLYMSFRLARTGDSLYQGIFAAFLGVLVHQQVDIPIWGIEVGGAFWLLVGLTISLYVHEMGKAQNEAVRGHWWGGVHRV